MAYLASLPLPLASKPKRSWSGPGHVLGQLLLSVSASLVLLGIYSGTNFNMPGKTQRCDQAPESGYHEHFRSVYLIYSEFRHFPKIGLSCSSDIKNFFPVQQEAGPTYTCLGILSVVNFLGRPQTPVPCLLVIWTGLG